MIVCSDCSSPFLKGDIAKRLPTGELVCADCVRSYAGHDFGGGDTLSDEDRCSECGGFIAKSALQRIHWTGNADPDSGLCDGCFLKYGNSARQRGADELECLLDLLDEV